MGPDQTILGATPLKPLITPPGSGSDPAKLHRVAKQFEAMFMTEMLRQAHPKSHAAGKFRTGEGEEAMQPFMDQALGDAVASRGNGTGLAKSIERALAAAGDRQKNVAARTGK
jgi:flagellar protein FlgJ